MKSKSGDCNRKPREVKCKSANGGVGMKGTALELWDFPGNGSGSGKLVGPARLSVLPSNLVRFGRNRWGVDAWRNRHARWKRDLSAGVVPLVYAVRRRSLVLPPNELVRSAGGGVWEGVVSGRVLSSGGLRDTAATERRDAAAVASGKHWRIRHQPCWLALGGWGGERRRRGLRIQDERKHKALGHNVVSKR